MLWSEQKRKFNFWLGKKAHYHGTVSGANKALPFNSMVQYMLGQALFQRGDLMLKMLGFLLLIFISSTSFATDNGIMLIVTQSKYIIVSNFCKEKSRACDQLVFYQIDQKSGKAAKYKGEEIAPSRNPQIDSSRGLDFSSFVYKYNNNEIHEQSGTVILQENGKKREEEILNFQYYNTCDYDTCDKNERSANLCRYL